MILVLLFASVKRFSVSRMRDYYLNCDDKLKRYWLLFTRPSETTKEEEKYMFNNYTKKTCLIEGTAKILQNKSKRNTGNAILNAYVS